MQQIYNLNVKKFNEVYGNEIKNIGKKMLFLL